MALPKKKQYSAHVELRLIVGRATYALAQLGPTYAIAAEDFLLEPTYARIEVVVDKRVSSNYHIFLPNGVRSRRFDYF
jgi:hypothetical protein